MRAFGTFVGVDLGGGKGKSTAVARLERAPGGVHVVDYGTGKEAPWFDDRLIAYLIDLPDDTLLAIDAPLTMPSCIRCRLPVCPTLDACDVPIVSWFRNRENGQRVAGKKPRYTPYTQRATEVLLAEEHAITPREALGQGMGPLTARALYLSQALATRFRRDENLIEVYPKATLAQLFSARTVAQYKRSAQSADARLAILNALPDLTFAPGAWREDGLANDHKFDAILCAYTAYLWAEGRCHQPVDPVVQEDGWIWFPTRATQALP